MDEVSATAKLVITAAVAVVAITALLLFFTAPASSGGGQHTTTVPHNTSTTASTTTVRPTNYTFQIALREYSINPKALSVYSGARVTLKIFNAGSMVHDLLVAGTTVDVSNIQPMQNASVTFTAPAPGTYLIYDNIGNDTRLGMVANLTVN